MKYLKITPWVLLVCMFVYLTKCQEKETITIIKTDTVTVVNFDTVLIEKEKPIYVERVVEKPTIVYQDSTTGIKTYVDTTFIEDSFYFWYNAKVQGQLNTISLSYFDNRPDKVITKTVDRTVTEKHFIQPKKLFIGSDLNTKGELTPGLMYVRRNWAFKGAYCITGNTLSVGFYIGF